MNWRTVLVVFDGTFEQEQGFLGIACFEEHGRELRSRLAMREIVDQRFMAANFRGDDLITAGLLRLLAQMRQRFIEAQTRVFQTLQIRFGRIELQLRFVAAGVTADLTARLSAVDLVKAAAEALGGKGGGGRPDMAQAGGADASKADEAIRAAEAVIGGAK